MLAAGADPKRANAGGRTALHYAASKGRAGIGLALLAAGASANTKDKVRGEIGGKQENLRGREQEMRGQSDVV